MEKSIHSKDFCLNAFASYFLSSQRKKLFDQKSSTNLTSSKIDSSFGFRVTRLKLLLSKLDLKNLHVLIPFFKKLKQRCVRRNVQCVRPVEIFDNDMAGPNFNKKTNERIFKKNRVFKRVKSKVLFFCKKIEIQFIFKLNDVIFLINISSRDYKRD